MQSESDEGKLKRYLLGEVTPQEQDDIHDHLFSDPDFSDELLMVERELTDDYLFGNLSPQQRTRFEQYFLRASERQLKLKIAQNLKQYASDAGEHGAIVVNQRRPSFLWRSLFLNPRIAVSALVIVLVAILLWLLKDRQVLKDQLDEMRARQDTPQQQDIRDAHQQPVPGQAQGVESGKQALDYSNKQKQRPDRHQPGREKAPGPTDNQDRLIAKAEPEVLRPGQERGAGQTNLVRLKPGAKDLLIQLNLDEAKHRIYSVEFKNENDERIWSARRLKARQTGDGKALIVSAPANLFSNGSYIAKVRGGKSENNLVRVDSYQFTVVKEQ